MMQEYRISKQLKNFTSVFAKPQHEMEIFMTPDNRAAIPRRTSQNTVHTRSKAKETSCKESQNPQDHSQKKRNRTPRLPSLTIPTRSSSRSRTKLSPQSSRSISCPTVPTTHHAPSNSINGPAQNLQASDALRPSVNSVETPSNKSNLIGQLLHATNPIPLSTIKPLPSVLAGLHEGLEDIERSESILTQVKSGLGFDVASENACTRNTTNKGDERSINAGSMRVVPYEDLGWQTEGGQMVSCRSLFSKPKSLKDSKTKAPFAHSGRAGTFRYRGNGSYHVRTIANDSTPENVEGDVYGDIHFSALLVSLYEPDFIASLGTMMSHKELASLFAHVSARDLVDELRNLDDKTDEGRSKQSTGWLKDSSRRFHGTLIVKSILKRTGSVMDGWDRYCREQMKAGYSVKRVRWGSVEETTFEDWPMQRERKTGLRPCDQGKVDKAVTMEEVHRCLDILMPKSPTRKWTGIRPRVPPSQPQPLAMDTQDLLEFD